MNPIPMTIDPDRPFPDVQALLAASEVRPPVGWMWPAAGLMLALAVIGGLLSPRDAAIEPQLIVSAGMMGLLLTLGIGSMCAARAVAAERDAVRGAGELVRLRRWPEAAAALERLMSRPMCTRPGRLHALVCLAAVAARYHRHDDAATVYDYLLDQPLDDASRHTVRAGRAMALLHDDRLHDADRAIAELRRGDMAGESALLALVEIYRYVKTGNPQDALEVFRRSRRLLPGQLGVRTGDALALAARACDMLGRTDEAQALYLDATTLIPPEELCRRYPETAPLAGRCRTNRPPAEGT